MAEVPITGIDHPVIAVRDMAAGRAAYERLGFTVTPRGHHREWGTGNWCIMFERDYLELRGVIDPKTTHNLGHFLENREGLMGLAFGTSDAEANYAEFLRRDLHPQPVRRLTRDFELPEGTVQPKFALCFLDPTDTPGLMSVVCCQHLTPELLRQPDWLRHANGARAVSAITGIVPDIAAAVGHYSKIFPPSAIVAQNDSMKIHLNSRQSISLVTLRGVDELWSDMVAPAVWQNDCLLSVTIEVDDIGATKRCLSNCGIECVPAGANAIRISPNESCGVLLEFIDRIE